MKTILSMTSIPGQLASFNHMMWGKHKCNKTKDKLMSNIRHNLESGQMNDKYWTKFKWFRLYRSRRRGRQQGKELFPRTYLSCDVRSDIVVIFLGKAINGF